MTIHNLVALHPFAKIRHCAGSMATGLAYFLLASCAGIDRTGPALGSLSQDDGVRLQIFLDSQRFGPGIVDGREGEFTRKALARFNQSQGRPAGEMPGVSNIAPYTAYVITSDDVSRLGGMAGNPQGMAQQKSLPYTSLTELLAERFHTSQAFIQSLNPGKPVSSLQPGDAVRVPNVSSPLYVYEIPATSGTSRATNPSLTGRALFVDLSARMLELREGSQLLAAFPITPGSAEHPAPAGEWKIAGITTFPWYRWDEGVLKRGERTENFHNLPPGPNSPVGILWMGLNRPGIGIHGTSTPETIGRSGSHGCIRLSNWDAARLRPLVTAGTPVTIR